MSEVGRLLREHRKSKGWSAALAAREVGVSAETWRRWETGKASPNATSLQMIFERLPDFKPASFLPVTATPFSRLLNRVALVLDDSGSMAGISSDAKRAFDVVLDRLRSEAIAQGQETRVDITLFGNKIHPFISNHDVTKPFGFSYEPRQHCTRLLDASAQAIRELRARPLPPGRDVAYLVIVVTDGEENASRVESGPTFNSLLRDVQSTDRWTVAFQLPQGSKYKFCSQFSVPPGNVTEWEQTSRGAVRMSTLNSTGISNYMNSRGSGQTSVKSFYTDLSSLTPQAVKGKLTDVSSQVRKWDVKKEQLIRPFVEERLGGEPMLKGAAFYQLTKSEKLVQADKKLLVVEKGKSPVYGGDDARQVLGLPLGVGVRLVPGNHANFDIFIQSKSVNRALVRGTRVIYWPQAGVPFTEGPSAVGINTQAPAAR